MKAIDTNVLVRFLVNDDQQQAEAVRRVLSRAEEQGEVFFVPLLVVMETIWVLDAAYEVSRSDILAVFNDLLLLPILEFEHRSALQNMVSVAAANTFDLADLLIAETARLAGCHKVLTFDKKAAKSELFELVVSV